MAGAGNSGAGGAGWDPAGKARMISHMNKDHSQDLSHMLQHFNGLSPADAAGAQMVDIDPQSMTVKSISGAHTVVLDPIMQWGDRRQRLIDMTLEARRALGVPTEEGEHGATTTGTEKHGKGENVVIGRYLPPRSFHIAVFVSTCSLYAACAATHLGYVDPGTLFWNTLTDYLGPGSPVRFRRVIDLAVVIVLGLHFPEMWWLHRSRLAKHGVPLGSKVWWQWEASCFIEGFCTFLRVDEEVQRLKALGKRE